VNIDSIDAYKDAKLAIKKWVEIVVGLKRYLESKLELKHHADSCVIFSLVVCWLQVYPTHLCTARIEDNTTILLIFRKGIMVASLCTYKCYQ
jgi:hypothetical protein